MEFKDFLVDDDGDLLIIGGDWAVGLSDQQNIEDIIRAFPGWWKQYPTLGVGAISFLNSGNDQEFEADIAVNLKSDGFKVNNPRASFVDGKLIVEANAVRV